MPPQGKSDGWLRGLHVRLTDAEGTEIVLYEGRVSLTGKPSMTADDGTVAMGFELSDLLEALVHPGGAPAARAQLAAALSLAVAARRLERIGEPVPENIVAFEDLPAADREQWLRAADSVVESVVESVLEMDD